MDHNLSIYLQGDYSTARAIVHKAARYMLLPVFWGHMMLLLLGEYLEWNYQANIILVLEP